MQITEKEESILMMARLNDVEDLTICEKALIRKDGATCLYEYRGKKDRVLFYRIEKNGDIVESYHEFQKDDAFKEFWLNTPPFVKKA